MSNTAFINGLLAPFEPTLPLEQLVIEVNNLYHAAEADQYDRRHPEVFEQLPPLWRQMLDGAGERLGESPWQVLDFGCGTGFEAGQLVARVEPRRLAQLTCYDPSPEMLARARERIGPLVPTAVFAEQFAAARAHAPYNVLLTNSLWHHLPDPQETLRSLEEILAPGAIWLAGHEPSRRFYANPECARLFRTYKKERRYRRFLSPTRCFGKLRDMFFGPAVRAARQATQRGLFRRRPTAMAINRLVDFHVAHSVEEAGVGRGFDFEELRENLRGRWELLRVFTYSYLGPIGTARLPAAWRLRCQALGERFPYDGANFCCVWRKM
jgi:SAM-dependent methyltransferase